MGRASLLVKPEELQKEIDSLESVRTFTNIGELCEAVSSSNWGLNVKNSKMKVKGISPQMVYIKIREFKLPIKTHRGTRGVSKGTSVSKRSREERLSVVQGMTKFSSALKNEVVDVPARYQRLAELSILGNTRASIALMCGQCMGYSGAEKSCSGGLGGTPCGLYPQNRLIFTSRTKLVSDKDGFYDVKRD